jgi:hypothetical protein
MRKLMLGALALALSLPISAETVEQLDAVLSALGGETVQVGHYKQRKSIKGFSEPLLSEGTYRIELENGVVWQQRLPFEDLLVIKAGKLYSGQGDQLVLQDVPASVSSLMAEVFTAMLAGDKQKLQRNFELSVLDNPGGVKSPAGWSIEMTPTSSPLNAIFSHVVLQGTEQVIEQITMYEVSGDHTVVKLIPIATSDALASWLQRGGK